MRGFTSHKPRLPLLSIDSYGLDERTIANALIEADYSPKVGFCQ
jgi:hypothetical protein